MAKPIQTQIVLEETTKDYQASVKLEIYIRDMKSADHDTLTKLVKKIQTIIRSYEKNGSN